MLESVPNNQIKVQKEDKKNLSSWDFHASNTQVMNHQQNQFLGKIQENPVYIIKI